MRKATSTAGNTIVSHGCRRSRKDTPAATGSGQLEDRAGALPPDGAARRSHDERRVRVQLVERPSGSTAL
jgi:hypothetical protein